MLLRNGSVHERRYWHLRAERFNFCDREVLRRVAAAEQYMTHFQGNKLWHLMLLEFWWQTNVDVV